MTVFFEHMPDSSLTAFLNVLSDGVYIVDKDGHLIFWNNAAETISGYPQTDIIEKGYDSAALSRTDEEGSPLCQERCIMRATMQDGIPREDFAYLTRKNGNRIPVRTQTLPLKDDQGSIEGAVHIFRDETAFDSMRGFIKELRAESLTDRLTKLPNRRHADGALLSAISTLLRQDQPFVVFMADIDHFKKINDTYGHDIGDKVLCMVADTFRSLIRPYDFVGRWGGEEFIGILPYVSQPFDLGEILTRYLSVMEDTFLDIGDEKIHVTLSIGASFAEKDDCPENILKRADKALYYVKNHGRADFRIADPFSEKDWVLPLPKEA